MFEFERRPLELKPPKKCALCGVMKPLADYHKKRGTKDGHRSRCKDCRKKRVAPLRPHSYEIDELVLGVTRELSRVYETVYPYMVQARLDVAVSESTVKRVMRRLEARAEIMNLGGRRGYFGLDDRMTHDVIRSRERYRTYVKRTKTVH